MMRKVWICSIRVGGCLVLAAVWGILTLPGAAVADPPPHNHGGGEVGQNIPVCITFDDLVGDGVGSDAGEYCDGASKGKVTARVGRNFNITLDGNNSKKKTAGRTLFLDLSGGLGCELSVKVDVNRPSASGPFGDGICDDCVDGAPDLPDDVRFGTPDQKFGFPDNARLQILGRDQDDLLVDADPDGVLVGPTFETNARLTFSVDGETWVLHWGPFKNPGGATNCPDSPPVLVTRTTNDTWTFESTGGHLACLYRAPKNSDPEYRGQFVVPFGATAVAIEPDLVGTPDGSTELMVPGPGDPECGTP